MVKLFYFTGKPCNKGHVSQRYVSNAVCFQCSKEKKYDPVKEKLRHERDGEKRRKAMRDWYSRNRSKQLERNRNNYFSNRNIRLEKQKIWAKEHPEIVNARNKLRHRRSIDATPLWVDRIAFYNMYQDCPIGFHVDHIVPIKGITPEGYSVSGLNVPWNLQYLTAKENMRKHNRMTIKDFEVATTYTGQP